MLGFCCLLKFLKSTGAERCGGVLFSLSFSAIQHPSLWSEGDRFVCVCVWGVVVLCVLCGGGGGGGWGGEAATKKWFKPVETVRGECCSNQQKRKKNPKAKSVFRMRTKEDFIVY